MSDTPKKNDVFQNIDDCKEYVFNGTEWVERRSDTPTPRTDAAIGNAQDKSWMDGSLCRQLERELAAVTKERDALKAELGTLGSACDKIRRNARVDLREAAAHIKRLEESGEELFDGWRSDRCNKEKYLARWIQAKEAR